MALKLTDLSELGAITATGQLLVANDNNPAVIVRDSGAAGNGASPWVQFQDSGGTNLGYVGYGSTGNSNLYIVSGQTTGNILLYNSTTRQTITTTYSEEAGSYRAPIFYDSNDTNYYVNPASGCVLGGTVTVHTDGDSALSIVDGGTNAIGIYAHASDELYLGSNNASKLRIHGGGAIESYADFRAPIFYDSASTGYYVDPASTSVLYNAKDGNDNGYVTYQMSGSDFANGTLVSTDIVSNTTNGDSFVIHVHGKSYSGEPPFAFKAQGYLYNDTVINYGGVSYGKNILTANQIKVLDDSNGKLAFWWPRVSYWNNFEVRVVASNSADGTRNRVTTIANATEPSASKKVTITLNQAMILGRNYGSGAAYASAFYDQDNTGYYINPAGASNIGGNIAMTNNSFTGVGGLTLNNGWALTQGGSNYAQINSWIYLTNDTGLYAPGNGAHIYPNASSDYGAWRMDGARNAWNGITFAGSSSTFNTLMAAGDGGTMGLYNDTDNEWYLEGIRNSHLKLYYNGSLQAQTNDGFFFANNQMRSPIFYDSNDTNYYTHPGDTSVMRAISIMQGSGLNLYQSGNASYAYQDGRAEGSYTAVYKGTNNGSGYGPYREYWYDGDSYHSLQISGNRWNFNAPVTASTDMRAPLFYDTDNTSYYLDPAHASTSLSTTGKWFMQGSHSSARIQLNYAHGSDATNSGTLTAWVSEPGITYENAGIGANIHVNGQYSGRAYDDGYGVYLRFVKGDGGMEGWNTTGTAGTAGGQGTKRWWCDGSGNLYGQTSMRTPIFYDSDDTGYYTNPASTSNMNTIGAAVVNTTALTATGTATFNGGNNYFNPDSDSQLWIGNAGTDALAIYGGSGDTIYLGGNNTWQMYFATNNYCYSRTWISLGAAAGIFSSTNGAHFYPNGNYTYGTWQINGVRNGYTGMYMYNAGVVTAMYDSGGNGGEYCTTNGWTTYYHRGNDCLGIVDSTTSSSYGLYVSKSIYSTADVVAYSDRRAKENIVTVDNALDKVSKLRGVYYNKKEGDDKSRKVGVIAQEVKEVLPEVVTYAKDVDKYGVDYGKINGLLIEAIKDLKKEVEELKKQLNK